MQGIALLPRWREAVKSWIAIALIAVASAGCSSPPPVPQMETRIVEVITAKPYRFITFSTADDPETIRQIKRHNRAHAAVMEAEASSKKQ